MEAIRQLVTRNRRADLPQLEHPDCYDEYFGREATGKIFTSRGIEVSTTNPQTSTQTISNDNDIEVVKEIRHKITVTHHYGKTSFDPYSKDEFEKINLEEYKNILNSKYWDKFVISIDVEEVTFS